MLIRSVLTASAALALVSLGCSPKDTTGAGPNHPADPSAAQAPPAPAPTEPAAPEQPDQPDEHDHAGHDHGHAQGESSADDGAAQPASDQPNPLIAAEMAAYQAAQPVFAKYCAECHTTGSGKPNKKRKEALEHFSIDQYPFTGHHAGELGETVRKVLGVGTGKATMPLDDPGAVKGEELDRVVAWSRAYDRAAQAKAGYHGTAKGHDH